jgi:hypothetical protein
MRLELMWDFVTLYVEIEPKLTRSEKKTNFVKRIGLKIAQEQLKKTSKTRFQSCFRVKKKIGLERQKKTPCI